MAAEKTIMITIIGSLAEIDRICKTVITIGSLQVVNAMDEIYTANFTMKVSEENKKALMGTNYIRPYQDSRNINLVNGKIDRIKLVCCDPFDFSEVKDEELIFDYDELVRKLDEVLEKFKSSIAEFNSNKEKENSLSAALQRYSLISRLNMPVEGFFKMKNFSFSLLKVSGDNAVKLNHNRENIPAILISVKKM